MCLRTEKKIRRKYDTTPVSKIGSVRYTYNSEVPLPTEVVDSRNNYTYMEDDVEDVLVREDRRDTEVKRSNLYSRNNVSSLSGPRPHISLLKNSLLRFMSLLLSVVLSVPTFPLLPKTKSNTLFIR